MSGKAIRETLGFLAVVMSLVFVGLEIRQNTAAQRAETRQALSDASREITYARATNRDLARAWTIWRPDTDAGGQLGELTLIDTLQARAAMFGLLRHEENVFLQYQEGVVDQSVLDTYSFTVPAYQSAAFRYFWGVWRQSFDTAFGQAFEEANGLRYEQRT